jgi:WD40 repeat protein
MINSPSVCPGQTNGPLPLVCADNECGPAVRAISKLMANTLTMSRILYRSFFLASAPVLVAVSNYAQDHQSFSVHPDRLVENPIMKQAPHGQLEAVAVKAPEKPLKAQKGEIMALAVTPDGSTLVSGAADNTIKLWSIPDGRLLATLEGHRDRLFSLAVTPDGRTLASGSDDKTIRLWSLPDGRLLATLKVHKASVSTLAFTPDGKMLVSGCLDKTIKLWSMPQSQLLSTLKGHTRNVGTVAITGDGKTLAGSDDKTIRVWSLPEGRPLTTLQEHSDEVLDVAITPDGKTLASSSADKTVKL